MTNPSWGTKRNCPSCSAHFYDLNKVPASCPKCNHEFDPNAVIRAKRKATRREAPEAKEAMPSSVLAQKKPAVRKKDVKDIDAEETGGELNDIAEIEDVDDLENLKELSELEEREEVSSNGDDADDEAIIEELDAGDKTLVGNIEDEEASALEDELDDEEDSSALKKVKSKKSK